MAEDYATVDEVNDAIVEVNKKIPTIDDKTIVKNEDGKIETALGGYIEEVEIPEKTFEAIRSYKSGSGY